MSDIESGRVTLPPEVRSKLETSVGQLKFAVEHHDLITQVLAAGHSEGAAEPDSTAKADEPSQAGQRIKKALADVAKTKHVGRPRALDVQIVQRIVRMRQDGMTISAIAGELTQDGIPTSRGGRVWSTGTIQTVLGSRTARGIYIEPNPVPSGL